MDDKKAYRGVYQVKNASKDYEILKSCRDYVSAEAYKSYQQAAYPGDDIIVTFEKINDEELFPITDFYHYGLDRDQLSKVNYLIDLINLKFARIEEYDIPALKTDMERLRTELDQKNQLLEELLRGE